MDPFKLFALLVAVACCLVSAEGPKKKIRIHLPQKVKHIHHHKKIYITNHAAAGSQYAPGYLASEAALAPGALLPAGADTYEEAAAGSKLLPLYRARGYYGPGPRDWDDADYDLTPPAEHSIEHSYIPSAFGEPSVAADSAGYPHKKVKVIKVNDRPRKKVPLKGKPKRGPVRAKPPLDEEIPVSTYHEKFYSDLDGSATIRKVKKPHRVEKIIDGDNEHIHTYSEEHIHKLVYDDGSSKLMGADPVGSMSALSGAHPIYPLRNSLVALSPETLTAFATIGSMGTPSHLEFAAYNPRDVTHDHIFHDHGEVPPDTDITKEDLPFPPRVSYNNLGVPIGGLAYNNIQDKIPSSAYSKPPRPAVANEYSYYENMFSPYGKPRTAIRPTNPTSLFSPSSEATAEEYGNVSSFKLRGKENLKARNAPPSHYGNNKSIFDYNTITQQTGAPSPFAVSSTVVHDYKPKSFGDQSSGSFRYNPLNPIVDPLQNFKDNSYTNNFEFDAYAAASNVYSPAEKYVGASYNYPGKKGKKKSVSTQNIRIGSLDHQTTVDHLGDSGAFSMNDGLQPFNPSLEFRPTKALDSATSTPYTIRESSVAHPYYSAMAAQALHGEEQQAQASSNNFQYVEAPTSATTEEAPVATTNIPAPTDEHEQQNSEGAPTEATEYVFETRQKHRTRDGKAKTSTRQRYSLLDVDVDNLGSTSIDRPEGAARPQRRLRKHNTEPASAGIRKYGDKI